MRLSSFFASSTLSVLTVSVRLCRNDYDATELRQGNRVVGLGERPYFDPKSKSRREVLGIQTAETLYS